MKWAWVENGQIRDFCAGDPSDLFHPDVAVFYDTVIDDDVGRGWRLVDGEWTAPPVPEPIEYIPPPPTPMSIDEVERLRRIAYATEADHLFFSWQAAVAEDAPDQDAKRLAWKAKREEIQARHPYPS
jgi:hypothetical protein